ncbi:MAG: imidazoleglycerol-phosphate dehydratase HisB [Rhodothermales bacterium]
MTENGDFGPRSSTVTRETGETKIQIELQLDRAEGYSNDTGIGFLDHMLDLFAKHGGFGLNVRCEGDLQVDEHHSIEDIGIALGTAFREALGDKSFIRRFGYAYAPMDDVLARSVVDLSGRFFLHFEADVTREMVGDFPVEMLEHFWYSFAEHARCNLHISVLYGENAHHQIEAVFKATARALREAVQRDPAFSRMPSTKGTI